MKDQLAELLLARVMQWEVHSVAVERPYLQAIAAYKYDEYEQFSPGMRFVERLALWLQQFHTPEEREDAYRFVKHRLLYISRAEIAHLVSTAYPDVIRNIILRKASAVASLPEFKVAAISQSLEFRTLRRQSLFLGLSDGAHTDIFRRAASEIGHEQVYQTYEISAKRAESMQGKLTKDLRHILDREPTPNERRFKMLFLLDDFSGSGFSYLRKSENIFEGKVAALFQEAQKSTSPIAALIDVEQVHLHLVLYVCTAKALSHLNEHLKQMWPSGSPSPSVIAIHELEDDICISHDRDAAFYALCEDDSYYNAAHIEDEHTKRGGGNVKYGFSNCRLPLILSHNTPNNSVSILWAYETCPDFRGLFARVPRHKELL